MRDFTLTKYAQLLDALKPYQVMRVRDYLEKQPKTGYAVLRHDVDRLPANSLAMAKLEAEHGVASSYYFRHPHTFTPEMAEALEAMGHEVGYHYEVLSKTRGDVAAAVKLFGEELEHLRQHADIVTVCMHGSPLSSHDPRGIWAQADWNDFGLLGEAFLSLDPIEYFSDTGRSWGAKNKLRDLTSGSDHSVNTTDELIQLLQTGKRPAVHLLVHPERWSPTMGAWVQAGARDVVFNAGKRVLRVVRKGSYGA